MSERPQVVVLHAPTLPTKFHTWPPKSADLIEIDLRIPCDPDTSRNQMKAWTVGVLLNIVDMEPSPTRSFVENHVLGALDEVLGSQTETNGLYAEAMEEARRRKEAASSLLSDG